MNRAAPIPVWAHNGAIRTYATVDAADAEFANRWRWHLHSGYVARGTRRPGTRRVIVVWLHRELLGITHWDGLEGDHVNRNRLDCRRSNLRVVTHAQNMQNSPAHPGSSSTYRGVSWEAIRRKWLARVRVSGKLILVGRFDDELDAANAVQAARLRLLPYSVAEQ